jgi:hypothetical protein
MASDRVPTIKLAHYPGYGLWIGRLLRDELASAQETAEIFLREANTEGRKTEAAVAGRILGMTCLWQGNFVEARAHLENSLKIYDPERDREGKFLFGWDIGAGPSAIIALTYWLLGEVGRAQERVEEAVARTAESAHEPTLANTYFLKALLEMLRGCRCRPASCGNRRCGEPEQSHRRCQADRGHGALLRRVTPLPGSC